MTTSAAVRKSRRTLLVVAGCFLAPLALAFVLYYANLWRPTKTTQKGELIIPARPLPNVPLTLADGTKSSTQILHHKWTWVYIGDGRCDARCRTALLDMRQARLLAGDKKDRLQRVFFVTDHCCDFDYLKSEQQGLIVAKLDNAELAAQFPRYQQIPAAVAGRIYLVDPLGNLMMSYASDSPSMGILDDIKKLLDLSQIG